MKGQLAAALVVILIAGAGGAYLFLRSPSTSRMSSDTGSYQSSSSTTVTIPQTQNTQRTTYVQITNATAQVTANMVTCNANDGKYIITLVNAGGATVEATGCTLNGQPGAPVAKRCPLRTSQVT